MIDASSMDAIVVAVVALVTFWLWSRRVDLARRAEAAERARLEAELAAEKRIGAERLASLQEDERKLREAFASLSADALRQNNQAFLDLAKESLGQFQVGAQADLAKRQQAIDELVRPVGDALRGVDEKIRAIENDRVGAYGALTQQVDSLLGSQRQLQLETTRLVQALRAPVVRGRWGEIQLRRVVEMAGMLEHCDFVEQETIATEDGRLRPDLVVRLPNGRTLVVDAKAPLSAYLDAAETADDAARDTALRRHAAQVRAHMSRLGGKAYQDGLDSSPDLVVMFLPGEAFFSAALQVDPELIEFGVAQRLVLASPITLIALLRSAASVWREKRLAENAEKISRLGRDLHDRVATMARHFDCLKHGLDQAVGAYNKAVGSLEGRVLVSARRFKELEAASATEIPELEVVEIATRAIQAPELAEEGEGAFPQ